METLFPQRFQIGLLQYARYFFTGFSFTKGIEQPLHLGGEFGANGRSNRVVDFSSKGRAIDHVFSADPSFLPVSDVHGRLVIGLFTWFCYCQIESLD